MPGILNGPDGRDKILEQGMKVTESTEFYKKSPINK